MRGLLFTTGVQSHKVHSHSHSHSRDYVLENVHQNPVLIIKLHQEHPTRLLEDCAAPWLFCVQPLWYSWISAEDRGGSTSAAARPLPWDREASRVVF